MNKVLYPRGLKFLLKQFQFVMSLKKWPSTAYTAAMLRYQRRHRSKGRFLEFRRYHYFANLFPKLSESTIYKEISKFQ